MTTLADRLAYLNELRAREDRPHLKSWKESRKALEDAIAKIETRLPKAASSKKAKSTKDELPGRKGLFAEWCRQHGINPKVARAKLRKHKVAKVGGHYPISALNDLRQQLKED